MMTATMPERKSRMMSELMIEYQWMLGSELTRKRSQRVPHTTSLSSRYSTE